MRSVSMAVGFTAVLAAATGLASCSLLNAPDQVLASSGAGGQGAGAGGGGTAAGGHGGGCGALDTLENCGVCGAVCSPVNANNPSCQGGTCKYGSCVVGFADCDGLSPNGCESSTASDPQNCGDCGNDCSGVLHVTASSCTVGVCDYQDCAPLFGDCDGDRTNGCERPTDTLADCGGCDQPCAPDQVQGPTCAGGSCSYATCVAPFDDCDGDPSNGCEADTDNDASHCGGCGQPCTSPAQCVGGQCGCVPTGQRAAFDTLSEDTASGCYSGQVCNHDAYGFSGSTAQNFQAFGQAVTCSGPPTCVGNVAVTTYSGSATVCQGVWDVFCDGVQVGSIDTNANGPCAGSAMGGACKTTFAPRLCSAIRLVAATDNNSATSCCGGSNPDSMMSSFSAW